MPEQTAECLKPCTCEWAKDGFKTAMEGLKAISGGATGYKIGTRQLFYRKAAEQADIVDYWRRMVEFYCPGEKCAPASLTGRDTATRIIPRDI